MSKSPKTDQKGCQKEAPAAHGSRARQLEAACAWEEDAALHHVIHDYGLERVHRQAEERSVIQGWRAALGQQVRLCLLLHCRRVRRLRRSRRLRPHHRRPGSEGVGELVVDELEA